MGVFVTKEKELTLLEKEYQSSKSSIVMIKGNYGVGKSHLINQFLEKKNIKGLYYFSLEESDKANRDSFRDTVLNFVGLPCLRTEDFSWDLSFKCYMGCIMSEKRVVVIEDIQHLIRANHLFLKIIHELYVKYFKDNNVLLIISGFFMNDTLEQELQNENLKVLELKELEFAKFKKYYDENQVELYSLTNGYPFYMNYIKGKDILLDLKKTILNKDHMLFDYPFGELKKLMNENAFKHIAILKCVALGKQTIPDICECLKMSKKDVFSTLSRLLEMHILKKDICINGLVFGKNYEIKYIFENTFMAYWIKYNYMNRHLLNRNKIDEVIDYIKKDRNNFILSETYCKICYETFESVAKTINFKYDRIAKYVDDEVIIDLVAVDLENKNIVIGDCTYKDSEKTTEEYEQLTTFYKKVVLTKFKGFKIKHFAIFNENGFSKELEEISLKDKSLILISNKK